MITDLTAWRTRFPKGGKVHTGFWRSYCSLRDGIEHWLGQDRPKRLVVTGHSLGAAMATVMAALHEQAELITFGCPRVGDREFAERFGRTALRYVDCTDFVTTVPYDFLGYTHFGEMRYIDSGGVVHPSPSAETMKQDRKRARALYRRTYGGVPGNVPFRDYADHTPVNYVSAVSEMRPTVPA
jgi:pimeloyl-ACP methyl ester carboxylesterase